MRKLIIAVAWVAIGATSSNLRAQSGAIRFVPPPAPSVKFSQPWQPAGLGGNTKVIGTVIDIRQVPVAHVKIQLRNLITGVVAEQVESNENGEYQFETSDPSTYVVEMVMVDGYVVALSNAGSLARYETMRTLVQLPGRWDTQVRSMVMDQSSAHFLGVSSQSTMTAATLNIAVNMNIAPISSGEPVSATSIR